ncbi:hypothetical protein IWQ60_009507 [Tieghemiomyces parasiticus]|uniref:RING-type E3 ubiquitin transferase n=1 Tax=Tieghemiomyces parasiticus TaxID=78921 RepID=A0A9W8DJS6_9FUNG|nr:hypothetical protein IWQ60_009507 [Tieghemiomyces parasiticus]
MASNSPRDAKPAATGPDATNGHGPSGPTGRGGRRGGRSGVPRRDRPASNSADPPEGAPKEGGTGKPRRNRPRRTRGHGPAAHGDGAPTEPVEEGDLCFICASPIKYAALGPCDHDTCTTCALRLRANYKTNQCPYCKTELGEVIFVEPKGRSYADYQPKDFPAADQELGIHYETTAIRDQCAELLSLRCQWRGCPHVAGNGKWNDLKKHVTDVHHMYLCDLCVSHRKAFAHELRLFTKSQLVGHIRKGDKFGFEGHPSCSFCQTAFYDRDQLYEHCRDRHEQCHICRANGTGIHQYYRNYNELEKHFRADHYVCLKPDCLAKKFVVFDSEIDLKAHMLEEHQVPGASAKRSAHREARQIPVDIHYRGGDEGAGSRSNSHASTATGLDQNRRGRGNGPPSTAAQGSTAFPSLTEARNRDDSRSSAAAPARRAPAGFGQLTVEEPEEPSTGQSGKAKGKGKAARAAAAAASAAAVASDSDGPTPSNAGYNRAATSNLPPSASAVVQGGFANSSSPINDWPTLAAPSTGASSSPSSSSVWGAGTPAAIHHQSRPILSAWGVPIPVAAQRTGSRGRKGKTPASDPSIDTTDPALVRQHTEVIDLIRNIFRDDESKLAKFRRLTSEMRRNDISEDIYVESLWAFIKTEGHDNGSDTISSQFNHIVRSVAKLLEDPEKQANLKQALKDHGLLQRAFPSLAAPVLKLDNTATGTSPGSDSTSGNHRILVIKSGAGGSGGSGPRLMGGTFRPPTATGSGANDGSNRGKRPVLRTFMSTASRSAAAASSSSLAANVAPLRSWNTSSLPSSGPTGGSSGASQSRASLRDYPQL